MKLRGEIRLYGEGAASSTLTCTRSFENASTRNEAFVSRVIVKGRDPGRPMLHDAIVHNV